MENGSKPSSYTPRPINPDDKSYRDVMMLFSDQPVKPKYWFEDFGDYWSCSCGQINRDETCSNCGLSRDLLRRIFIIQKDHANGQYREQAVPSHHGLSDDSYRAEGDHADTSALQSSSAGAGSASHLSVHGQTRGTSQTDSGPKETEAMTFEEIEAHNYKRRKRRTKVLLGVLIFIFLLLGGALAAFYFYYVPELEKEETASANATKSTLTTQLPTIMKPIANASFSVYRNAGDRHYEKKEYLEAIEYYNKAMAMHPDESVRQKILAAKYSYVANNQEQGGNTFKKFLDELKKANYPGIENIYERTYEWKASIVANTSSGDTSTDMDSIHRTYLVFFHTKLSGGPPDEKLNLYYHLVWPDGTSERQNIASAKGNGDNVTTQCEYTFPKSPSEVRMTYKIYNSEDDTLLATDSVTLL